MMDLQAMMEGAMAKRRTEVLKSSPQILLGELILKLESVPDKTLGVVYDFDSMCPGTINSWRGSYDELALSFDHPEGLPPSVNCLLKELRGAIGKTYTGYKGGEYLMGKNIPVWVDNYGESGDKGILDVLPEDSQVILKTGKCEF